MATTTTTTNQCTFLAIDDTELRKYKSTNLEALDDLVNAKCDGCGALHPSVYGYICPRHVLGGCCLNKKTAHFKICSDRRGDHRMCPKTGCRNTPIDKPVVDHRFTAVMIAGRRAVDSETRADTLAEIIAEVTETVTAKVRAEMNDRVPSRKAKADHAPGEWERKQTTKKMRKAERNKTAEINLDNAMIRPIHVAKIEEFLGVDGYQAWIDEVHAANAMAAAPAPIAADRMECDRE